MDPDPTAPLGAGSSGFIVFSSMIESSMKCSLIYAADVKSRQHLFKTKNWRCKDYGWIHCMDGKVTVYKPFCWILIKPADLDLRWFFLHNST